jgi:hypothetical protein
MLKKTAIPVLLTLLILVSACAKRNTEYQQNDVLTLLHQVPVVGNPLDLSFDGSDIYAALDQGGISVIDGSTYTQRWLTHISAADYSTVPLVKIRKVAMVGEHNRLFLNETDATDKIQIVNTTDPDTLKVIDSITGASQDIQDMFFQAIPNPTDDNIIELIYCEGRNVHYGRYNGDLWLGSTFSISTPSSASGVCLTNDYVFVAAQQRGLLIYDRGDQHLISELAVPGEAMKVKVSGNYAYIASQQGGLNVVNVSDPAHPVVASTFDTSGYATSVDVSGSYAVVSSGGGGVYLFDLAAPGNPELLQRLNDVGYTNNAKLVNGKLIVASRDQGILIYNIDDN